MTPRQVSVEFSQDVLEHLRGEEPVAIQAEDGEGNRWNVHLQRDADRGVVVLRMSEQPAWNIAIEGVQVGSGPGADPQEAAREVLRASEITSLPEAVAVQVSRPGESWMVFTLGSQAFCVSQRQFNEEVVESGQWVTARQKKKREIDALQQELRKIVAGQRG